MNIDPATLDWRDAHELLAGAVVPRPIAFVSTISQNGIFNVAPFTCFAPICVKPMLLGINCGRKKDGQKKDTQVNIESNKEFVVNVVTEPIIKQVVQASTSYPYETDEFKETGLTPVKADAVKPPLVAESPVNLECRLKQMLEFGTFPKISTMIIGEVVRVHAKDEIFANKIVDTTKLGALGRMGGELYCRGLRADAPRPGAAAGAPAGDPGSSRRTWPGTWRWWSRPT